MSKIFKITITLGAITLFALHQFFPSLRIDATSLVLLAIAILPWILKYISGFEIPGVVKIDLKQAKSATDKVTLSAQPQTGAAVITGHTPAIEVAAVEDSFSYLRTIFDSDPNIALVAFRIEIELRIRKLASAHNLLNERVGLQRMIRALVARGVLNPQTGSGLTEIVALGNSAAHGAEVSTDAANWVLDIGPSILIQLDALLGELGDD